MAFAWLGGQRRGEVGGHLDRALARIGGLPAAVRLGPLDRGQARWVHPSFGEQSLDVPTLRSDHWLRARRGVKRWR